LPTSSGAGFRRHVREGLNGHISSNNYAACGGVSPIVYLDRVRDKRTLLVYASDLTFLSISPDGWLTNSRAAACRTRSPCCLRPLQQRNGSVQVHRRVCADEVLRANL
jgi:hypothetical protein